MPNNTIVKEQHKDTMEYIVSSSLYSLFLLFQIIVLLICWLLPRKKKEIGRGEYMSVCIMRFKKKETVYIKINRLKHW